jgi:hypothetical protein
MGVDLKKLKVLGGLWVNNMLGNTRQTIVTIVRLTNSVPFSVFPISGGWPDRGVVEDKLAINDRSGDDISPELHALRIFCGKRAALPI